jgi:hypothetical protein
MMRILLSLLLILAGTGTSALSAELSPQEFAYGIPIVTSTMQRPIASPFPQMFIRRPFGRAWATYKSSMAVVNPFPMPLNSQLPR